MRWHNGRSRRSRNLYSENASKGSETKKDEGAAHSIQARRSLLQQRPNTFAQTNSVFLISRLQNGGGPYIPCGRSHVRKPVNECIGDSASIDRSRRPNFQLPILDVVRLGLARSVLGAFQPQVPNDLEHVFSGMSFPT